MHIERTPVKMDTGPLNLVVYPSLTYIAVVGFELRDSKSE